MTPAPTDYVTHAQLDAAFAKFFVELKAWMNKEFAPAFEKRLTRSIVDEVTEVINDVVELVDDGVNKMEARLDRLETKMDAMISRVGDTEQVNKVQDARLGRLETKVLPAS